MGKNQITALVVFGFIFAILYFGCETKSPEAREFEKSRALNFEKISIPALRNAVEKQLAEPEKQELHYLEQLLREETDDLVKIEKNKDLSAFWYANASLALSGYYAQKVAESAETAESWSISGTTYFLCAKNEEGDLKEHCLNKAISSFEQAISLEPDSLSQRINLALCYVDFPPEDNPMKGIQQLLSLQGKYPESSAVQLQLARLGIQTGQYEKAIGRLLKVLEMEPNNTKACCFLMQAYEAINDTQSAGKYIECCKK